MRSNRIIQLNTDKTEVMWCASTRKLPQLPSHSLSVTGALVCPVNAVRDLGVFINNDLGAATHVRIEPCHAALLRFASSVTFVDTSPTTAFALCRVVSLVHSRLDYIRQLRPAWSGFLLQRRLQSVLNAAARLVFRLYVVTTMSTLHWLRLPQRVDFKVAVMAFRMLHGLAPGHLNELARVAHLPSRRRLRSALSHQLLVPPFRLTIVGRRTFSSCCSTALELIAIRHSSIFILSAFRQRLKTFLINSASLFLTLSSDYTLRHRDALVLLF